MCVCEREKKNKRVLERTAHILPRKIIEINILVHKFFGTIGKSGGLEDSVTTERMLTWFLKIYYCSDTIPLELIDDVPFSNDP